MTAAWVGDVLAAIPLVAAAILLTLGIVGILWLCWWVVQR